MKIVFVNPPTTKEERYGALAAAGSYSPPLALCSLAGVAQANGHEAVIIDAQVEGLDRQGTLDKIKTHAPRVVGITSTTSTFLSTIDIAWMVKKWNQDTTVVAGGVHISALPEESLLKFKDIDIAVLGEGEETLKELLDVIENKGLLRGIKGIAFRENGQIVFTENRPLIKDLDTLPLPAWGLLPDFPNFYSIQAQSVANFPSTSLCTSRGCTGKCTFCDRRVFGSSLRAHSAEYVFKMVKDLYDNFGIRDFQFEDDNFMLFKKRLFKVCEMFREEKLDITWTCQARVDMVRPETLKVMREAGCWMILFGVESGSQKILDFMKKEIDLEKIKKAVELTHNAGILCKGFFISGFLNEDKGTLKETYDFIKKCELDDISFHYYTPFPGSPAYSSVHSHGTLKGDTSDMTYYRPVFIANGVTEEDLIKHTKACYRRFYLKPKTILGYIKRVKSLSHFLYFFKSSLALFKYILQKKG